MFFFFFMAMLMLSVAFFTLMERKYVSLIQFRLGPNKNLIGGLIQPILDGFKFFTKNSIILNKFYFFFFLGPLLSFSVSNLIFSMFFYNSLKFKMIFFLIFMGVSSYIFIITGWASFSKFSYLGGIRASSQILSYEIILTLFLFITIYFFMNKKFMKMNNFFFFMEVFNMFVWMIIILSETNRAPFDFSEGESELISGFNVEFGSLGFTFFMLSEYTMMIFFSFFVSKLMNFIMVFFLIFFLVSRTSFPRFRYDFLMNLMWMKLLPFTCFYFIFLNNF